MAEVMVSSPMNQRRVFRAICFAVAAVWPAVAAVLTYTDVSALWGGGRIGADPHRFYWVFLSAYSTSLILFVESVRRRSWPGVCIGALYLLFWAMGGWAVAILPA